MGETITEQGEIVGICGWNGTSWEPILIDDTKRLVIAVASIGLPSGAATSAKQLGNDHDVTVSNQISGFATATKQLVDGHNVAINNVVAVTAGGGDVLFNYENVVSGSYSELALDEGLNYLSGSVVPTGKVHVIQQTHFVYHGTPPTLVYVAVQLSPNDYILTYQLAPADSVPYIWTGEIVLKAGEKIRCVVTGATADDILHLRYRGYVFDAT